MTFSLTSNFFQNARGITFEDGGGVVWAFDQNTNQVSAAATGSGPGPANPTGKVGLTVVNGTAVSYMRSDGAPPIDETIAPTWTGIHTFTGGITVAGTITFDTHTLVLTGNASITGTNTGDQAVPSAANPTASVGLSAVNGSATTFMRSDGAPPIDETIAPTWTGIHTFTGGITVAGTITFDTHTLVLTGNASITGTNTGDQAVPSAANPTASVGLSAVNGSATTFMRSDGAPPIDETIAPTWTGIHTFQPGSTGNQVLIRSANSGTTAHVDLSISRGGSTANAVAEGPSLELNDSSAGTGCVLQYSAGQFELWLYNGSWAQTFVITSSGLPVFKVPTSIGWGTPTGASVENNFAGASASLATCTAAVAEIIAVLKSVGIFGS